MFIWTVGDLVQGIGLLLVLLLCAFVVGLDKLERWRYERRKRRAFRP